MDQYLAVNPLEEVNFIFPEHWPTEPFSTVHYPCICGSNHTYPEHPNNFIIDGPWGYNCAIEERREIVDDESDNESDYCEDCENCEVYSESDDENSEEFSTPELRHTIVIVEFSDDETDSNSEDSDSESDRCDLCFKYESRGISEAGDDSEHCNCHLLCLKLDPEELGDQIYDIEAEQCNCDWCLRMKSEVRELLEQCSAPSKSLYNV